VVLLTPDPDWVRATMPNAKLPDRGDFRAYGERVDERRRDWARAVAESARLADEFADLVRRPSIEAEPLP
ncbi:MAG TPA: phospholipase, partial [Burkholderiaceae bacterium]|nr:phospholipase [Burkholderiaceae bacterium]